MRSQVFLHGFNTNTLIMPYNAPQGMGLQMDDVMDLVSLSSKFHFSIFAIIATVR